MKVYFVSIYDAQNIKNWSGTAYYLSKSLEEAGVEIEYIGNLESLPDTFYKFRLRNLIYNKILGKRFGTYISFYEPENLKHIASQVEKKLSNSNEGIVFSPGAVPLAYLKTDRPLALWADATFAGMQDYYTEFTGLHKITINHCHEYERSVLKKADLAIFSSEWAGNSAIKDYGANPDKIKILSYGANIECARTKEDIEENNRKKSKSICKLLFIGQDWERKGGNAALLVAEELNKRNIQTELTIVGCTPHENTKFPPYVKVKGYINKSEIEGKNLMNKLYNESHFFILPTLAECTPIVFSEANSFGLPVLTTSTGGISSVIKNDVNGKMFGEEMDVLSCSSYIYEVFSDYKKYEKLSLLCFNEYLTKLNWEVSISKLIYYFKHLQENHLSALAKKKD